MVSVIMLSFVIYLL